MATSNQSSGLQRYVVIHVATTCDEHGVYVTKDSAEVIELGWILLDSSNCEEACTARAMHTMATNTFLDHSRERPRQARQHSNYSTLQYVCAFGLLHIL